MTAQCPPMAMGAALPKDADMNSLVESRFVKSFETTDQRGALPKP